MCPASEGCIRQSGGGGGARGGGEVKVRRRWGEFGECRGCFFSEMVNENSLVCLKIESHLTKVYGLHSRAPSFFFFFFLYMFKPSSFLFCFRELYQAIG